MIESLKIIGFIAMVIDHITLLFFPGWIWGRIIGRTAAPIFFYLISKGIKQTKNFNNYLLRLIGYGLGLEIVLINNNTVGNILITLAIGLITLKIASKSESIVTQLICVTIGSIIAEQLKLDYGAYGIWAIYLLSFYSGLSLNLKSWGWWILWLILNYLEGGAQIYAVWVPVLFSICENIPNFRLKVNWYDLFIIHWSILLSLKALF